MLNAEKLSCSAASDLKLPQTLEPGKKKRSPVKRQMSANVQMMMTDEESSSKLGLPPRSARSFGRSKSANLDEQMAKTKSAKGTRLNSSDGFQFNVSISDDRSALRTKNQNSSNLRSRRNVPKV